MLLYKAGFITKNMFLSPRHLMEAARDARNSKANYPKDCPSPSYVTFFWSTSTLTLPASIRKKLCPVYPW